MTGSRLGGLTSGKGVPLVLAACSYTALIRAPLLPPAGPQVSTLMQGQAMARSTVSSEHGFHRYMRPSKHSTVLREGHLKLQVQQLAQEHPALAAGLQERGRGHERLEWCHWRAP